MKLAVSNIAWTEADDAAALPRLRDAGVEALEVAPGRVFADALNATIADAEKIGGQFANAGLPIGSMQSLLFGRPELTLFGSGQDQQELLAHLTQIISLAGALGCGPLVFGSPKNRLRGDRSFLEAADEATPILKLIGDIAVQHGCTFCLEANASGYGCDFMTVLGEASAVAAKSEHPGVAQVVDTGNMMMAGETPAAVEPVIAGVRHLHISAPNLGPVAEHKTFIEDVIARAISAGYDATITVEMRPIDVGSGEDRLSGVLAGAEMVRAIIDRYQG